jgi:spore maturation protein SpmB
MRRNRRSADMTFIRATIHKFLETLETYWILVRIIVPVAIATELMARTGLIKALSPLLAPVMGLYGLPADLGLAWLTGMLVGIWGAVPLIFALVPASSMTVGDITVFSALLLFAHALPIEQKIIQKAGPGFFVTTLVRIAGGMIYAALLHQIITATGWLSEPLDLAWIPMNAAADWIGFFEGLLKALISMLVILVALAWTLELLKLSGLLDVLTRALKPFLELADIHRDARHFTTIGLFLGISYGGGPLLREARTGGIAPRQVFVSCVFMGFAHSVIEDTLIVMALGADVTAVLVGRLIFAVAATALIARLVLRLSDEKFFAWMFRAS